MRARRRAPRRRILVVDDEPAIRALCRVNLERLRDGCARGGRREDGARGRPRRAAGPDPADVMLPGATAAGTSRRRSATRRARAISPVVFLTAMADADDPVARQRATARSGTSPSRSTRSGSATSSRRRSNGSPAESASKLRSEIRVSQALSDAEPLSPRARRRLGWTRWIAAPALVVAGPVAAITDRTRSSGTLSSRARLPAGDRRRPRSAALGYGLSAALVSSVTILLIEPSVTCRTPSAPCCSCCSRRRPLVISVLIGRERIARAAADEAAARAEVSRRGTQRLERSRQRWPRRTRRSRCSTRCLHRASPPQTRPPVCSRASRKTVSTSRSSPHAGTTTGRSSRGERWSHFRLDADLCRSPRPCAPSVPSSSTRRPSATSAIPSWPTSRRTTRTRWPACRSPWRERPSAASRSRSRATTCSTSRGAP